ncbi:hypothetical protein ACLB2K_058910 [Fragaria x ananassa]
MADTSFHDFIFGFCTSLLILTTLSHSVSGLSSKEHASLFIFGDSIFDAGNNNYINTSYRANFQPYGETFFKNPTGRFSDGRLISDFIAEYGNLPIIPLYLQPGNQQFTNGSNFASAGAGALVETFHGLVLDLNTQLSYFERVRESLTKNLGDEEAKTLISRAVYMYSAGSNDYSYIFGTNSSILRTHSHREFVGMVLGNITAAIKVLRRGRWHVAEVVRLEELSAAEAREEPKSMIYARIQVTMSSSTLVIQQKGSISNLLCYSGVELPTPLLLTISKHYSKIEIDQVPYLAYVYKIEIIDMVESEYAKLPIVPAYYPRIVDYTYGVNFASGGAGALNETHEGLVLPLNYQLHRFENVEKHLRHSLGDAEAYTLLSNAVYLISIGANDYIAPLSTNCGFFETRSQEEYVGMVIGNLTNVIEEIYNKGGRKFGLPRLPPLGQVPAQRPGNIGTCVEELTSLANMHNAALPKHLEMLKSKLQGFKYSIAKLDTYLDERINNPSEYGFKEGKTACCGSGPYGGIFSCGGKRSVTEYWLCANVSEYVFFDSFHPTERVYQQISKLWWNQARNDREPCSNLKELFEV